MRGTRAKKLRKAFTETMDGKDPNEPFAEIKVQLFPPNDPKQPGYRLGIEAPLGNFILCMEMMGAAIRQMTHMVGEMSSKEIEDAQKRILKPSPTDIQKLSMQDIMERAKK